jgi:transposase
VRGAAEPSSVEALRQRLQQPLVVAPAPERPIDGGMATEALVAHVLVSKFCDSLPLYRQSQMLARHGVTLDRSMLSKLGRACLLVADAAV